MSNATDDLIAALATEAKPVRRLWPPALRAATWLALLIGPAAIAVIALADLPGFLGRTGAPAPALAWAGSLTTGVVAVIAAAHLSLPDRSRRWALAPLPFLAVWLGASSLGCLGLPAVQGGEDAQCFIFILASGVPLTAFLFWRLRLAYPIDARLVAVVGALGAAGLSAALLQFFHPFSITWLDLGIHLAGVAAILVLGAFGGRALGSTTRRRPPA